MLGHAFTASRRSWLAAAFLPFLLTGCKHELTQLLTGDETTTPDVELTIVEYDTAVIAGDYANVKIEYAKVDPKKYSIYVEIGNGQSVAGYVSTNTSSANGSMTLKLPIEWTAPAGSNYFVTLAAVANKGGWESEDTVVVERRDRLIALSVPNAPPSIQVSATSTSVAAGDYLTLNLTHANVNFTQFDLQLYLRNEAGFYESVTVEAANNGTRQIQIAIPWNTTPADRFIVGWSLTSKTGGANDPKSTSQELTTTPVKVTAASAPIPTLNVVSYPAQMNAGEYADVVIEYGNVNFSTHKLSIEVRNDTNVASVAEVTQGTANGRATVQLPIWWDAPIGSGYYVQLAAVDIVRDEWADPKTVAVTAKTPAITLVANPPPPQVSMQNFSREVRAGEYYTVNVQHQGINFTTHELLVYLHNMTDPTQPPLEASLASGADGVSTLKLPVFWTIPAGTQFEIEWIVFARSGGFSNLRTIGNRIQGENINVLAPTATPPSLTITSTATTVNAGQNWNATLTYSGVNMTTHDLFAALINDNGVVAAYTQITTPVSGTKSIQVPTALVTPAGNYHAVLAALPRNGKTLGERMVDPMTAIARGQSQVNIVSSTPIPSVQLSNYATTVSAGSYLSVTAQYDKINRDTHDLLIYVANSNGVEYDATVSVDTSGKGTATVQIPVAWTAAPASNYVIGWAAISKTGGRGDPNSIFTEIPNVAINVTAASTPPPVLQISNYSTSVTAGGLLTVKVTYSGVNFATHDLYIDLSNGNDVYGRVTYTAASGIADSGTLSVNLEIDVNAPAGNNYYLEFTALEKATSQWHGPKTVSTVARYPAITITK